MAANSAPPVTPSDPLDAASAALAASGTVASSSSSSKNSSSGVDQLANIQGAQLAAQVANWAAQLEFAKERFRLLELPQFQAQSQLAIDQLAFQKASTAWQQAFQEASVTGTYQGVPTTQWLTQQAQLTGVLGGNQTIQGKLTDAQVAQMNSAMKIANDNQLLDQQKFGFQQTQWNAEFALSKAAQTMQYTGYTDTGAPTLQREAQDNASALQYENLLASLRGPENAFAQARVIGNTPQSIKDIAAAWLGKYQIGGTTGSGMNPTPINAAMMGGAQNPGGTTTDGYTYPTAPGAIAPFTWNPTAQNSPTTYSPFAAPPAPAAPAPVAPGAPAAPVAPGAPQSFTATPANDGPIPGRGLDPSQWNAATAAAVSAWNASHPGFQANGSQLGYGYVGPVQPSGALNFDAIPGRGMDASQWNPATQAAVTAWNASHPGYVANGSQVGYAMTGPGTPGMADKVDPTPAGPLAPVPYTPVTAATASPGSVAAQAASAVAPAATPVAATAASTPAVAPYAYPAAAGTPAPLVAQASATTSQAPSGESAVYSPPGTAAPAGMYNYTPTSSGGYQISPPGVPADPNNHQMSTSSPADPNNLSNWFSGVLPSQVNAKNYGNMNSYDQTLGWSALQDQGWDIGAAQDAFKKSLPRYAGPSQGSFGAMG